MSVIHNIDEDGKGFTLGYAHARCFPRRHYWKGSVMNTSSNALKLSHSAAPARASGPTQPGRLRRLGSAVWRTLETVGRVRARRELLALADRWESQRPELAAQMRAATNDMGCV
jgi:hypothetical protein